MTAAGAGAVRRIRAVLVSAALLSAGTLGAPGPAHAAGCSGGSGVTVVVDFGPYGGVQTGCAADPTNGLSALSQAGFSTVQVTSQPGFVCRINSLPPAEDDACVRTPPETAYWAYWQAGPGSGSWTYSGQSAASTQPQDGASEGWSFGAGGQPGLAPPVNTAPPPPPPPPPPPSSQSAPPSPSAPPPASTSARPPPAAGTSVVPGTDPATSAPPAGPGPSGRPGSSAVPAATTGPSSAATSAVAADSPDDPPAGSAEAASGGTDVATATDDGGGTAWSLVIAGLVAATLGGGAYWQIRQRR